MAMNSQILSKEQVLIVGCGDIGQRLAQCLSKNGYKLTGLRRNPPANTPFLDYQKCDASDLSQLSRVLQQRFDIIIISMTPTERTDSAYQQAYVQTCVNLVAALKTQMITPRLILFVSSTAVYSQKDGSWVDESSPTEPDGFSGKRLLEAEKIILNSDFNSTIMRFSGIYGPGRNHLIEQVRQGRASASTHFTNRIHADDCARAIAHVIELGHQNKPVAPVYLATDSLPATMLEVVTWLAGQLGVVNFLAQDAINERGNKRCSNQLLLASGFSLRYPEFRDGYSAMLKSPG